jgi:hypothetical protein
MTHSSEAFDLKPTRRVRRGFHEFSRMLPRGLAPHALRAPARPYIGGLEWSRAESHIHRQGECGGYGVVGTHRQTFGSTQEGDYWK